MSDFSPGEVVLGHVVNWLDTAVEKGSWEGDTVFLDKNAAEIPCHIKITPTMKNNEHIGYCGVTTPLKDKLPDEVMPKISFFTKVFKWMVIMRLPFLSATFVPIFAGAAVTSMLGEMVSWSWLGLTLLGGAFFYILAQIRLTITLITKVVRMLLITIIAIKVLMEEVEVFRWVLFLLEEC